MSAAEQMKDRHQAQRQPSHKDYTPVDWERLLEKERRLEENAVALGGVRFRKRLQEAQEQGKGSTVGAAKALLGKALSRVEEGIVEYVDGALGAYDPEQGKRVGGKRGGRPKLAAWVVEVEKAFPEEETFDAAGASYITLKTVLDHIHYPVPLSRLAADISTRLIDEMRYRKFRREAPALFKFKLDNFTTDNYAHRDRSLAASMRFAEIEAEEFDLSSRDKIHLGTQLINIVAHTTGLVEERLDTSYSWSRGRVSKKDEYKIVVASDDTVDWINRRNDILELLRPTHMPMVVPPLPWKPGQKGGYLFNPRVRKSYGFIRGWRGQPVDPEVSMPKVYEAINRMQETAFAINRPVLRLLEEIVKNGGGVATVPSMEKVPMPAKLFDAEQDDEARKEDPAFILWKRKAAAALDAEAIRVREVRHFDRILDVAQTVADERAIWFPWNVDFRGRAYPLADALSPQGDDMQKALLRFADGKPLGKDGAFYLAIHGANCLDEIPEGLDGVEVDGEEIRKVGKLSIYERNAWIERHTLEIAAVAEDPFANDWWTMADKPLMFYAFCCEWAGYWEAYQKGRGEEFVSHLPVAADGTCNGLQHFAALWLDEEGAFHVNVTPNDRPQDVYARVADVVQGRLEFEAGRGNEAAALWLDSGLMGRGLMKRPTMTFGYGSRRFGFADQLLEYVEDEVGRRKAREFFDGEDTSLRKACTFMARLIWESLDDVVVAAKEGMDWFQACAREIVKTGEPVSWAVPLTGFRVEQPYYQQQKRQIETVLLGRTIQPVCYDDTDRPDPTKQANAISPNVIHSLDAAALMLCVVNCTREHEGRFSFQMVHDSFATHARDAGVLARVLRESFVQLYTQVDVVEELRSQFEEQVEEPEVLPEGPSKGSLDLSDVLVSDHFFC